MTEKYFKYPFADQGDREAVPDDQVNTLVNYQFGYTPEYELNPDTDPDGNFVGRHRFNQVMYDMTAHAKKIQDDGYTLYFADVSYKKGRIVVDSNGDYYRANQDVSGVAPPSAEWDGPLSDLGDSDKLDGQHGSFYRDASNLNSGTVSNARLPNTISSDITGNAATADNADKLEGKNGGYYRNASNLNNGTVPTARLPEATTETKGIIEKATLSESKNGISDKYPDAAGVHSAFNQYGIGTLSVSEVFDFNDLFPSGIYKITSSAGNPPSPDWMGGVVFRCSRDGGKIVSDLAFDVTSRLYYRVVQGDADIQDADWHQLLDSSSEQQIGVNQSWQDLTSSRSAGVNYTNNTGKPIMVYIALSPGGGNNNAEFATVDGVGVGRGGADSGQANQFIVPDGSIYSVDTGYPIEYWSELR